VVCADRSASARFCGLQVDYSARNVGGRRHKSGGWCLEIAGNPRDISKRYFFAPTFLILRVFSQPSQAVGSLRAMRARQVRNARHSRRPHKCSSTACEVYLHSACEARWNWGQPPDPNPPLSRFRTAHRVCRRSNRDATAYMPTPIAAITRSAAKTSGTRNVELAEIMR
jgi:hypothetical protein